MEGHDKLADEWLSRQQAAELARLDVSTIDRARATGELKATHCGRRVLIRRRWLDAWIAGTVLLALHYTAVLETAWDFFS